MNNLRIFLALTMVSIITGALSSLFLHGLEWIATIRLDYFLYGLPIIGALYYLAKRKLASVHSISTGDFLATIENPTKSHSIFVSIYIIVSTWLSHLVGASVGREGTAVTMGASLADTFSKILKIEKESKADLIRAGISGGFASVFGTPLAGLFFGLEIKKIGTLSISSFLPCLYTAFLSNYLAIHVFRAKHLIYPSIFLPEINALFFAKLMSIGLFLALIAYIYKASESKISQALEILPVGSILKGIVGGLLVLILLNLPGFSETIGLGSDLLLDPFEKIRDSGFAYKKLLATILSVGVGFKGGEATPLFLIGSYSIAGLHDILNLPIGLCAAIGFSTLYTGITKTPLAGMFLGIELFGLDAWYCYLFVGIIVTLASGRKGLFTHQEWSSYLYVRKNN